MLDLVNAYTEKMPTKNIRYIKDFLKLPEAEIYYEIIGNGPPIVFAHGLGGNHLSWWRQIPFFAERFTCVTFSHRGFLLSKNIAKTFGAKVFADDLSALIDHLELKDVHLVAQSMGGWTSLNYALRPENKLKSLVMASTTGELNFSVINHPAIAQMDAWKTSSEKIKKELKSKGLLPATGARMAVEQPSMNFLYAQIYDLTPKKYKDKVRKEIRSTRVLEPKKLKDVKQPVMFLAGSEDIVFPPLAAEAASTLIPNAKFVKIFEAGHSVYFERPDQFNAAVDNFISGI